MSLSKIMKWIVIVSSALFLLDTVVGLLLLGRIESSYIKTFFEYLGYMTPLINSMFMISMGWIATKSLAGQKNFSDENGGDVKRLAMSIVIALIFVPIVFAPSMLYPYIVGKAFAFRFLALALFAVVIYLALSGKNFWIRITPLVASFALLTFFMGLSTLFSIDGYKSFWGNYERMEGYISTVFVFLLLLSVTAMKLRDLEWRKVFAVHFGVSLFVSGVGILQYLLMNISASSIFARLPIFSLCVGQASCKADATLGNSIYLGIYAALSLWIIIYVIYRFKPVKYINILWIGAAINFLALLASGARGSQLGLLLGGVVAYCVYLFLEKNFQKLRVVILVSVLVGALLVGTVVYTKRLGIAENIPLISKFSSTNTLFARLNVWQTGVAAFKEKPIFGWGQENFIHVFNKLYNPAMFGQETYFDHPHNTYLGWLAMGGILGFIAYLLFLASVVWSTFKSYIKEENNSSIGLSIALGVFTTYFFHIFFVFDSLTSTLLFSLIVIYFTRNVSLGSIKFPVLNGNSLKSNAYILSGLFILMNFFFWYKPIYANILTIKALSFNSLNNPVETVNGVSRSFQKAINVNTFGNYEIRELYLQKATEYANLINQTKDKDLQEAIVKFNQNALAQFTKQTNNSYDHKSKFMLGMYYTSLGSLDNAEKTLVEALSLAPNKQVVMLSLARVYLLKGDGVKALELYKRVVDVTPKNSTQYTLIRIQYVQALMATGKDAEAIIIIKDMLPATNRSEFQVLVNSIGQVYGQRQDLKSLIQLLLEASQLDPRNENFVLWLAQAYVATGNYEAANAQIEKLQLINPDFVLRFKTELQALVKQRNEDSQKKADANAKEAEAKAKSATTTKKK